MTPRPVQLGGGVELDLLLNGLASFELRRVFCSNEGACSLARRRLEKDQVAIRFVRAEMTYYNGTGPIHIGAMIPLGYG